MVSVAEPINPSTHTHIHHYGYARPGDCDAMATLSLLSKGGVPNWRIRSSKPPLEGLGPYRARGAALRGAGTPLGLISTRMLLVDKYSAWPVQFGSVRCTYKAI